MFRYLPYLRKKPLLGFLFSLDQKKLKKRFFRYYSFRSCNKKIIDLYCKKLNEQVQTRFLKQLCWNQANDGIHDIISELTLQLAINVLKKQPDQRTDQDLNLIAEMIKDLKFFQKNVNDPKERFDFAKGCARFLRYVSLPKGSQVFRWGIKIFSLQNQIGDPGNEFYLIMRGEVFVYVPKSPSEVEQEGVNYRMRREVYETYMRYLRDNTKENQAEPTSATRKKRLFTKRNSLNVQTEQEEQTEKRNTANEQAKLSILTDNGKIYNGDKRFDFSYEEKLLLINSKRGATYFLNGAPAFKKINYLGTGDFFGEIALIFHTTRTASIIASEDCHLLTLNSIDYKEVFASEIDNVMKKVDYVSKLFPTLGKKLVMKFCYLLEEKTFTHNEYVYKEGDPADAMYIVKSGEIQLSRVIEEAPIQVHAKMKPKKAQGRRKIVLANLLSGNFFGDLELIDKVPRECDAVATKSGTFTYRISKKDFDQVISKYFSEITQHLREKAVQTTAWRKKNIEKHAKIILADINLSEKTSTDFGINRVPPLPESRPPFEIFSEKLTKPKSFDMKVYDSLAQLNQPHRYSKPGTAITEEIPFPTPFNRAYKFTVEGIERVKPTTSPRKSELVVPQDEIIDTRFGNNISIEQNLVMGKRTMNQESFTKRELATERTEVEDFQKVLKRVYASATKAEGSEFTSTSILQTTYTSPRKFSDIPNWEIQSADKQKKKVFTFSRKTSIGAMTERLSAASSPNHIQKLPTLPSSPRFLLSPTNSSPNSSPIIRKWESPKALQIKLAPIKQKLSQFSKICQPNNLNNDEITLNSQRIIVSRQASVPGLPKLNLARIDTDQIKYTPHTNVEGEKTLSPSPTSKKISKTKHNMFRPFRIKSQ